MASFARISIMGNLGSDPETRYTPNGAMNVQFSIAVNPRKRPNDTQDPPPVWYRVTAWGELADRVDKLVQAGHISRGRGLYVEGSFEPRTYTGNDGSLRTSYDVRLSDFQFVGLGQQQGQGQGGYGQQQGNQQRGGNNQPNDSFDGDPGMTDIDDVPF